MTIKIWHCHNARSFRALWAMEEMNIDYEVEVLPFPPRYLQKAFLEINPLGTIPYMVDGETHMTESSAIPLYLLETYNKHEFGLKPGHPEYGDYLNWLFHSDATLTFPQTVYIRYSLMEPKESGLAKAGEGYRDWYLKRLVRLNNHIDGKRFLVDDRFTIADIDVTYALFLGEQLGFASEYTPQVNAYLQNMKARPAFQHCLTIGREENSLNK